MEHEANSKLLQRLLAACNEGSQGAIRLAHRTDVAPLRDFLQESAQQYRRAADEILAALQKDGQPLTANGSAVQDSTVEHDEDIVASWERTDCEALTWFRDAYDTELPSMLADTVKRHLEAGVTRLERLRRLQRRLG